MKNGKDNTKKIDQVVEHGLEGLDSPFTLDHYYPAFFTFIANKLASGASSVYRSYFGIGIEAWRVLVMLALDEKVSVNMVCKLIGMDKGSVSRCFKVMHEKELIFFTHDANDGRVRYATLTDKGKKKYNQVKEIALERQQAFLSCLSSEEQETLIHILQRLHSNIDEVEHKTSAFLEKKGYKKIGDKRE